jgi:hypothetical protein
MAKWDLFAPVNIDINGSFDPVRIEQSLEIGLFPQIVLDGFSPKLIADFADYLRFKKSQGSEIKVAVHPRSTLLHLDNAQNDLEGCIAVNQRYGSRIISEVIFHPGQIISAQDEAALRSFYGFKKGAMPLSEKHFRKALDTAKESYSSLLTIGANEGIDVLAENPSVLEFEPWLGSSECLPAELWVDPRWNGEIFVPALINVGLLGSCDDLVYIVGSCGRVCIDIEHLKQTEEFFAEHYRSSSAPCMSKVEKFHSTYWEGSSRFYGTDFIASLAGNVSFSHLAGLTSTFYEDNGAVRIGSHMPITFPGDENEFIVDDGERARQNLLQRKNVRKYISALHKAGCRKALLEIHVGEYSGPVWRKYMIISKKNVESVIAGLE